MLVNQAAKYWFLTQRAGQRAARDPLGRRRRRPLRRDPLADAGLVVHGRPGPEDRRARRPRPTPRRCCKAAIRDDNPVLFFEHKRLYGLKGEVDGEVVTLGEAARRARGPRRHARHGHEGRPRRARGGEALAAATASSVEVIDLRTLRPLDTETVLASVRKTNRLVVVEEGPLTGGWAGEVLARVTEQALGYLDDAWRLRDSRHADPVQPAAGGRVPARRGSDRLRDSAAVTVNA